MQKKTDKKIKELQQSKEDFIVKKKLNKKAGCVRSLSGKLEVQEKQ